MALITSYASGQCYLINVRPYETCLPVLCEFVRMHILSLSFACSCVRIVGDESKVIRIANATYFRGFRINSISRIRMRIISRRERQGHFISVPCQQSVYMS